MWLLPHMLAEPDSHFMCNWLRETVKFHSTLQAHTKVARIMKVQATPKLECESWNKATTRIFNKKKELRRILFQK